MTEDEFAKLVGDRLFHVTLAQNVVGIRAQGLLRPATLARKAGVDPASIVLRDAPVKLSWGTHHATLNHQKPLLAGRGSVDKWLDGISLADWAAQLDQRCFFWSERANLDFQMSLLDRGATTVLSVDSREIYRRFFYKITLSPINSGNATRRPSPRGRWLYVPISAPLGTLHANRTKRGLVKAKDTPTEISLTEDLTAQDLIAADLRQI